MSHEIYIEDARETPSLSVDAQKLIEEVINETLSSENVQKDCFVSVTVVDPEEIREINNEHRNIDSVTDVLSFPVVNLLEGDADDAGDYYEGRLILGDVVLCAERAKEQSEEFGHSIEREIGYLTCHSILHLIGYDHETEEEREVMREKEESVMRILDLGR